MQVFGSRRRNRLLHAIVQSVCPRCRFGCAGPQWPSLASRRDRGGSGRVEICARHRYRRRRRSRRRGRGSRRGATARDGVPGRIGGRGSPCVAVERHPVGEVRGRSRRRTGRWAGLGGRRRRRPVGRHHREQAEVARRQRTRQRGPHRSGLSPTRLVELAPRRCREPGHSGDGPW
jgi:hypothetical protein